MAIHTGSQRSKSLHDTHSFSDNIQLTQAFVDDQSSLNLSSSITMATHEKRNNILIFFVFILEVLVLIFLGVLAYFLRETDVFPVRQINFTCEDKSINQKAEAGENTFDDFAYKADVPYEVVLGLSFAVPSFIIIVSEIALWAFSDERQKTVRAVCSACKVPQVVRRIIRFVGTFIFGLLITMIFTDVAKHFTGRLRPTFLDTCKPNVTLCRDVYVDESVCTEDDEDKLRKARLSFPSLHTAISSYAAFYLGIYLHNVIRYPGVRIIRSFMALSFVILSIMCGMARYGLHYSHWTDCLTGFILGFLIAVYLCFYVVNKFREHMNSQQLYSTLKSFLVRHRLIEFRDLYKEVNQPRVQVTQPRLHNCDKYCYGCNDSISANSWKLFDYTLPRNQDSPGRGHIHGQGQPNGHAHVQGRVQGRGQSRGHSPPMRYYTDPSRRLLSVFDARAQYSPPLPYDELSYYHAYNDPYGYYWYS